MIARVILRRCPNTIAKITYAALMLLTAAQVARAQVLDAEELTAIAEAYATEPAPEAAQEDGEAATRGPASISPAPPPPTLYSAAISAKCAMTPKQLTLAPPKTGGPGKVVRYLDGAASGSSKGEIFTSVTKMEVNTDGAARTYHPLDPFGECLATNIDPDTKQPVCAINYLCYGGVKLLENKTNVNCDNPKTAGDGSVIKESKYKTAWLAMWKAINDGTATPLGNEDRTKIAELLEAAGVTGSKVYGFHDKAAKRTVVIKEAIIPSSPSGRPCRRTEAGSKFLGFFVNSTSLKGDEKEDEIEGPDPASIVAPGDVAKCNPIPNVNSERVKGIVIPVTGFAGAKVGDVVIAYRSVGGKNPQWVYGLVGDEGPATKFGEASLAFNGAFKNIDVDGRKWKNVPDIWDRATVYAPGKDEAAKHWNGISLLILRESKSRFGGDYSRKNIESTVAAAFNAWGGGQSVDEAQKRFLNCREVLLSAN